MHQMHPRESAFAAHRYFFSLFFPCSLKKRCVAALYFPDGRSPQNVMCCETEEETVMLQRTDVPKELEENGSVFL